jgi:hypothetical protein
VARPAPPRGPSWAGTALTRTPRATGSPPGAQPRPALGQRDHRERRRARSTIPPAPAGARSSRSRRAVLEREGGRLGQAQRPCAESASQAAAPCALRAAASTSSPQPTVHRLEHVLVGRERPVQPAGSLEVTLPSGDRAQPGDPLGRERGENMLARDLELLAKRVRGGLVVAREQRREPLVAPDQRQRQRLPTRRSMPSAWSSSSAASAYSARTIAR